MRVLVIPEDFRKDQYVLKPLIDAMMGALDRPKAKVVVLKDPLLGGITEALKWENIAAIIDRYRGMIDLFLLIVDRDGVETRRVALTAIEEHAKKTFPAVRFLGENAWQELEVWAIAAQPLPNSWSWADIRSEVHPKEAYFVPLATQRKLLDEPGQGRLTLGLETAKRYSRVRKLCPEDVGRLEERAAAVIA